MANLKLRVDDFISTLKRSPDTLATYRNALNQFLWIVGEDAELDTRSYTKFLKTFGKLSPSTQRVYSTTVLQFYEFFGAGNERELKKVTKHYTKTEGERVPKFNREAIENLMAHCSLFLDDGLAGWRDRAFIYTLTDTGLRISEACRLRRGDIDWQEQSAIIIGKGDKQTKIRFSDRSIKAINDYLRERAKLDGSSGKSLASLPLFARHDKGAGKLVKPIQAGGMWFAIKARMVQSGIDKSTVRIHDFRHYFVSSVYAATGDIMVTKELARHSKVTTTQRYTHLNGNLDKIYHEIFNGGKSE